MSTEPFLGLTMSVFTAFGWAGEETAIKFALEQMELFVQDLHLKMARETQTVLPHRGLDRATQGVFLARALETESDLYITFHARPMAFRMAVHLNERMALARAFSAIQANMDTWYESLKELGDGWEIRFQQMEYNPDTEAATHYKDLYKGPVAMLTPSESAELVDRMAYLNSEEKWLAPIQLSKRMGSEFIAAMGTDVGTQTAKEIDELLPVLRLLAGGLRKPKARGAKAATGGKKRRTTKAKTRSKTTKASTMAAKQVEAFTYSTKLKPLHIRKGFVNMTEAHWPFFAINSRTTTRDIILKFDGNVDRKSSVWRMMPTERARLVLSDRVQIWMEENFSANDEIQIAATKVGEKEIEIDLALVD